MKVKLEIIQGALVMALIILFSTSISNAEAGKTTVSENLSRTTTWVGSSVQAVANNAGINSGIISRINKVPVNEDQIHVV